MWRHQKFIGKSEAPTHIPLERNTRTENFVLLIVFSEHDINKTTNRAAIIYDVLKNENSNLQAGQNIANVKNIIFTTKDIHTHQVARYNAHPPLQ